MIRRKLSRLAIGASISLACAAAFAGPLTDYFENKVSDWAMRGQAFTPPTTGYIGLIVANKGPWAASTAYASGDYVYPASPNGRLYKAAGACTSGASTPTWGTTAGGATSDNTCSWTEQTTALEAGTVPEVSTSGTAYARASIAASLANWSGTQGAGTTVASSGTGGQISNNNAVPYTTATANWGYIWGWFYADALTGGNVLIYTQMTTPVQVTSGATASFAAGQLQIQLDN